MRAVAAIMASGFEQRLAHGAPADRPACRIVDRIHECDGGWDFAAVDRSTGHLYVAHGRRVERIDLASRRVVDPLPERQRHVDGIIHAFRATILCPAADHALVDRSVMDDPDCGPSGAPSAPSAGTPREVGGLRDRIVAGVVEARIDVAQKSR